jgi:putative restriction endonuclease
VSYIDDRRVRLAAFEWLRAQTAVHGETLHRDLLMKGFELDGQRIPLVSRQGIFKPKVLREVPLSITTTTSGPYPDRMGPQGLMLYSYRGTDPMHSENRGLRKAMSDGTPLVYFHGLVPSIYMAVWPVFIVDDNPSGLEFTVAVDDRKYLDHYGDSSWSGVAEPPDAGRRQYVTAVVKQRLHQQGFRERVLVAYREQCALCRLRHRELLDAAHIIPDGEPRGAPVVSNGLALCKLHHAAFDSFFLGITPDYKVQIRADVLAEKDGPMLIHGLQGLHDTRIVLPRSRAARPDPELLEIRYERFVAST